MKYLFGASGHARVIVDVINSVDKHSVLGIFDDDESVTFNKIPFLGKYIPTNILQENAEFLISIGDNKIRKKITEKVKQDFFTACDKSSIISSSASIGVGTVVMQNAVINAYAQIGNHCIINTSAIIEHDCILRNFVHVSPHATITGNVKIEEGSLIGAGSVVAPNINIGKWCVIGAGTVVIKDVPDYAVVVGNPGKVIRYNER